MNSINKTNWFIFGYMSWFRKYVLKQRNNKFVYYAKGVFRDFYPRSMLQAKLPKKLAESDADDYDYLQTRLRFYNKIDKPFDLPEQTSRISDLKKQDKGKVYYFDTIEYARFFNPDFKLAYAFGDVTHVPDQPAIVKSRPIRTENANSVLLKLNKVRHYTFVNDNIPYDRKKDQLIWRGVVAQEHRKRFMEMYFGHPLCNLGKINDDNTHPEWLNGWISINQHLTHKFILSVEGNDVATNLKWIMSSNSIAVMPKPKNESWFMESRLIPDVHYIEIDDDYSNLIEKLEFYLSNPQRAKEIARNANEYVAQFKDNRREELLSLLVLEKYFVKSGQMEPISMYNKITDTFS